MTNRYTSIFIERKSGGNFQAVSYILMPGNFKGFIQPISGDRNFQSGKSGEKATHRLYTNIETPSLYGDKITQDGQTYIVLYGIQPNGISSVGHHKEIILGLFQ